ncbi:MAG: hypothetical protein RLZZ156_2173 [Deinococcota bacterium]|jgi:3-dehydroquinate synthase
MIELRLDLSPSYPIQIAAGLLKTVQIPERTVAVLCDEKILPLYASQLVSSLEAGGVEVHLLPVPSGERVKTLDVHARLLSELAQLGLTRDSAVFALGGGATSDLAGYVAASYLRGIAFYVCPTTLLAMVDASVGGKTGVNLPEGKNLVGAFHQPRGVFMDTNTLESLPETIFREGAAELFKHGLIRNPALCNLVLETGFNASHPKLETTLAAGVQVKIEIVQRDPFEQNERAYLNIGHTLAHALEAITQHGIAHGEAVGYGMHFAAILGKTIGYADLTHLTSAFLEYQKPSALPSLEWTEVRKFMARDKKADSIGVRFVLLEEIAKPKLERVSEAALQSAWAEFIEKTPEF